jgi:hypothetical protein
MTDLVKWERNLEHSTLLSGQESHKLFSPSVDIDSSTSYCYGWFAKRSSGKTFFYHPGFYKSFGTEYRRYPGDQLAIIITSNQGYLEGNGMQVPLCDPIAAISLGKESDGLPPVIALPVDSLRRYVGTYKLADACEFEIYVEGGALKMQMTGQATFDAIFAGNQDSNQSARLNRQAAIIIEASERGDRQKLQEQLPQSDYRNYIPQMDSGWSSLVKQYGAMKSYEVLGTGPYPFTDAYLRTYARLRFIRGDVIITIGYREGAFFDLSTWEGVPNPGALLLSPISRDEFVIYNLWTQRMSRVVFETSDGFVSGLHIDASDRQTVAKRID